MEELDQSIQTTVTDVDINYLKIEDINQEFYLIKLHDQVNIQCATGYNLKFIIDNGIGIGP